MLDLTEPNGLFLARDFIVRDDDLLYVTEAPLSQWNKTIAALTGSLGAITTLSSTATSVSALASGDLTGG